MVKSPTDYMLVCKAELPTGKSKPYVRWLRSCFDMTDAISMASCDVIENDPLIRATVDSRNYTVKVCRRRYADE